MRQGREEQRASEHNQKEEGRKKRDVELSGPLQRPSIEK